MVMVPRDVRPRDWKHVPESADVGLVFSALH